MTREACALAAVVDNRTCVGGDTYCEDRLLPEVTTDEVLNDIEKADDLVDLAAKVLPQMEPSDRALRGSVPRTGSDREDGGDAQLGSSRPGAGGGS